MAAAYQLGYRLAIMVASAGALWIAAERGWIRLRGSEDWVLVVRMAATVLEVEASIVAEALDRRRGGRLPREERHR